MIYKICFTLLFISGVNLINAQFVITANNNPTQLLQSLQGQGVTLSNPVVLCHNCGIGTFSGGNATNLGINSGVVMSTGTVLNSCIINAGNIGIDNPVSSLASTAVANAPGDPLVDLISPSTAGSFDRCRLEFDITPTGDTVSFDYVFASEEYTNYVCTQFNDAFGFFVSGPKPGGGSYTNQNVALVPGTNLPVLINSINDGTPNGTFTPCYTNYTQYYVTNTSNQLVFDGHTTVLTAKFAVIPCQTYHIILVIGDVGDRILDSGVFLEAKSFSSTNITITATTSAGQGFNNAVEGCVNAQFRFKINPVLSNNLTINYSIGGTATNGVDYATIPNSITIPAGDSVATIPINVFNDGIPEQLETVKIYLLNPCNNQPYDSAQVTIQDSIFADAWATDYFICKGETTILTGSGGLTYSWTPAASLANPNSVSTLAAPDTTTTYLLTAFVAGCFGRDTVTIHVSEPNFTVDAGPDVTICANQLVQFAPTVNPPSATNYTYAWTPSTYITPGTANTLAPTAYPQQTIKYTLTVNNLTNGCTLTDTFRVTVAGVGPPVVASATPAMVCPGQQVQLNYISQPLNCGVTQIPCFGIDKIDSLCANCFTQTGSPTTNVTIYGNSVRSRRIQMLYRASELLPIFGGGGTIRELAWRVGTYNSNATLENFTIRIKCVPPSQTTLTNWETGLTTVFGPKNYTPINGAVWNFHQLDSTYNWDGVSNLVIEVCFFNPNTFGSLNNMMQVSNVPGTVLYSSGNTNQCGTGTPLASSQRPKLRMRLCQPDYNNLTTVWTPSTGVNAVSNPNIKSPTASPQSTQTYQVTVSQNGCIGTASVTVNVDTSVKVNAGPDQSFCVGQNVTLTATPSGTPLPGNSFSYQWRTHPGNTLVGGTQSVTVNPAVTTSYVVSMSGGACTVTDTVTLNIGYLGLTRQITPISCSGAADAKIRIIPNGNAPYTFTWSANAGAGNVDSAVNLGPGTYYVTVTDALNCVGRDTITITAPQPLSFTHQITHVTCHGGSNGQITVSPTGGNGSYNFLWSNGLPNSATVTGLSNGSYNLTITDAKQCSATGSFLVTQPPQLLINNVNTKNVRCHNGNDGYVAFNPAGGTGNYSYSWSHNNTLNSPSANSLSAGIYSVTVTDANLCSVSASFNITQPNTGISFQPPNITDVICHGGSNGQATVNPTGGTPPYTYLWTPGNQTGKTATGLSAQTYTVQVTDDSLCTATTTITVNQPPQILISGTVQNVSCNGGNNGSINLTVTNGVSPLTYAWSNAAGFTEDPQNLSSGTYQVTVTDNTQCTQTATFTITQPSAINVALVNLTHVSCYGGNNGSITINVTGGSPGYNYVWSPAGNSPSLQSLQAGTYQITVTDQNSCTVSAAFTVNQPSAPLQWITPVVNNVSCFGGSNGSIQMGLTGGTPNYTYQWSHSQSLTGPAANALAAGNYTVTARDANNCTITAQLTVNQPPALIINSTNVGNVTCYGASTGSILVNVSGGTGPYSYTWNGTPGPNPASGLPAGNYQVIVTDANNCSTSATVALNQPAVFVLNPTVVDASCYNSPTGSIDANPTGGTPPYAFNWSPGNYSGQVVNMVYANTYQVVATDAKGCTASALATVGEPTELTFTLTPTAVKCVGDKNGTIRVDAAGATPPYSYSATQDFANFVFETDGLIRGLAPGWYYVVVADLNGCTKVDSVYVPDAVADNYIISTDSTSCYGTEYKDGAIHITGTTIQNMPYQYSVDGGPLQYNNSFYFLGAGEHTVTGVNNHGCVTTFTVTVPQPEAAFLEVFPGDTTIQLGQTIQLSNNFGPYPLSDIKYYDWHTPEGLSCSDCPSPLATPYNRITEYTLTVTYNKNCKVKASMTVIVENNLPVFIPNAFSPNGDGNNDVFQIYGQGIKTLDLMIYNRWGELVFETNNQFEGWDGSYKGVMQQPAVFTYYARIRFLDDKVIEKRGSVTLVR